MKTIKDKITEKAETRRQRRLLAKWLHEWRLDQALRSADTDASCNQWGSEPDQAGVSAGGADVFSAKGGSPGRLAVGQVWLLHPDSQCTASRPLYVLLLAQAGDGRWLAVPFGRFAVPAIPGEWRTGMRAMHARVLCLWNTRYLDVATLRKAWKVTKITPDRLATARGRLRVCFDLSDCVVPENDTASTVLRESGPPLLHPADPRHQYLAEETDLLDAIGPRPDGMNAELVFGGKAVGRAGILSYPGQEDTELLRAAERKDQGYGKHNRFGGESGV